MCDKAFAERKYLIRHQRLQCMYCTAVLSRNDTLRRHIAQQHNVNASMRRFNCNHCDFIFPGYDGLFENVYKYHRLSTQQTGAASDTQKTSKVQDAIKAPSHNVAQLILRTTPENSLRMPQHKTC